MAGDLYLGALLEPEEPALVYLDLLQAMAFLVAWSALVITITIKMVNANRDLGEENARIGWQIEEHVKDHPNLETQMSKLESNTDTLLAEVEEAKTEVDKSRLEAGRLRKENIRLLQILSESGIPFEPEPLDSPVIITPGGECS